MPCAPGAHQSCQPCSPQWSTTLRFVIALARRTAVLTASDPVRRKATISAAGIMSTKRCASSACQRLSSVEWPPGRAVAQRAIDVAMAVDVPEIGRLRIAKRTAARPRSGHSRPRACGPTPAPGRRSRDRDGAGFSPLSDPARRTPCRPGRSDRDNARRRQYPPEATRTPDDPGRFRL